MFSPYRSGAGNAVYRESQGASDESLSVTTDADVEMYFRDSKFALVLTYKTEPRGTKQQRIVADDKAISATRFSDRISRTGATTRIVGRESINTVFPWDVSQLARSVLDLDIVFKKHSRDQITIDQTPTGDLACSFRVQNSESGRVEFQCLRAFGFNLANVKFYPVGDQPPNREIQIEWLQTAEGLWHINSLKDTRRRRPDVLSRRELIMKEFDANAEIPDDTFTEAFLNAPVGSRVIDTRTKSDEKKGH